MNSSVPKIRPMLHPRHHHLDTADAIINGINYVSNCLSIPMPILDVQQMRQFLTMCYFTVEYLEIFDKANHESMNDFMVIDTLIPRYLTLKQPPPPTNHSNPSAQTTPQLPVALSQRR